MDNKINRNVHSSFDSRDPGNSSAFYAELTKSSEKFIPDEIKKKISIQQNKNVDKTKISIIIISLLFVIELTVLIIFGLFSPTLTMFLIFIFGIIFLFLGFGSFSKHSLIESTPLSKIESAPIGLNIFNVQFVPIEGNSILSPISKKECVAYTLELYNIVYNNQTTTYVSLGSFYRSVPSLLYDNTGYLALSPYLPNYEHKLWFMNIIKSIANGHYAVNHIVNIYNLRLNEQNNNTGSITSKLANDVKNLYDNRREFNTTMLNAINDSFKNATLNKTDPDLSMFNLTQKFAGPYILYESYVPTNTDYTAIGEILHTTNKVNDKPVHILSRNESTNTFSVKIGNEKKIASSYLNYAIGFFVIGTLLLLLAIGWGSYNGSYSCWLITNHNTSINGTETFYYFNGTSKVLHYKVLNNVLNNYTLPPPSQPSSTGTASQGIYQNTLDCGDLFIVDSNYQQTEYYKCNWTGGNITISLEGGNSGHIGVKITSLANGRVYYAKNSTVRCLTPMANIYLPKGEYEVYFNTGAGGGSCGPDILQTNTST